MRFVKTTVFYLSLLTILSYMVSRRGAMLSNSDSVPKEEECSIGACEDQKNQETEKKTEIERKTVQSLRIRVPRVPDVSVLFINKISW